MNATELDHHRLRIDYSVTKRAHTPSKFLSLHVVLFSNCSLLFKHLESIWVFVQHRIIDQMDIIPVVHHHRIVDHIDDIVVIIADLGSLSFVHFFSYNSSICLDRILAVEVALVVDHDQDLDLDHDEVRIIIHSFDLPKSVLAGDRRRRSPGYAHN